MAYAYWKSDKTDDQAVFDLFFRNNPFHGEFTIFAGLEECLKFLDSFHYSQSGKNLFNNLTIYFEYYLLTVLLLQILNILGKHCRKELRMNSSSIWAI